MYNQLPQPGMFELPSEQCLLHVGNLIEPYPILRIRCSVQVMASRWLRSETEGLRWGGNVRVVFYGTGVVTI